MTNNCKAGLVVRGQFYKCDTIEQMMLPGSEHHEGWAHSNREAEAVWLEDTTHGPSLQDYRLVRPMLMWVTKRIQEVRRKVGAPLFDVVRTAHTHDGPCPPHHANHEGGR